MRYIVAFLIFVILVVVDWGLCSRLNVVCFMAPIIDAVETAIIGIWVIILALIAIFLVWLALS